MKRSVLRVPARLRGYVLLTEGAVSVTALFNGEMFLNAQGRFSIGTDSNIRSMRPPSCASLNIRSGLKHRSPHVMTTVEGKSTGPLAYNAALAGGTCAGAHGNIGSTRTGPSRRYCGA